MEVLLNKILSINLYGIGRDKVKVSVHPQEHLPTNPWDTMGVYLYLLDHVMIVVGKLILQGIIMVNR
jgi:hypothetical protein